jgi:hypothetical protein
MRQFTSFCVVLTTFQAIFAQTPQTAENAKFTSTTQLVVETVSVKDKSGKPLEGLTAKDFTITEDGVPQTIKFFEYQKFDEKPSSPIRRFRRSRRAT